MPGTYLLFIKFHSLNSCTEFDCGFLTFLVCAALFTETPHDLLLLQDTLFDPVALGCGHLFCNNCACTAANVLGHEGPRAARCDAQCAICRQVHLTLCFSCSSCFVICLWTWQFIRLNLLRVFFLLLLANKYSCLLLWISPWEWLCRLEFMLTR